MVPITKHGGALLNCNFVSKQVI